MAKRKALKMPPKEKPSDDDIRGQIVRYAAEWTPSKLRTAKRQAEGGNLAQAVGVCELLLSDERIVSGLRSSIYALLGLTPSFEPAGDRRRSNRAVKALEAGEDWWRGVPEPEVYQIEKWSRVLGVAPFRNRWTKRADHGGRLLPMTSFMHPQGLRQDVLTGQWFYRDAKSVEHEVNPGDGEWGLHMPCGATRPWADGAWYCLAHWVLLKAYAVIDSGRKSQQSSMLTATSPAEADSTKELRRELADSLLEVIRSGGEAAAALPPGFKLEAIKISEGSAELFDTQIDAANEAITILLRGGNLTTKVEGGSRAAADTQAKQNEVPMLRFHAEALSTTLHDQVLEPWAQFNFADAALAPWPVWPTEPEEDRKQRGDMIVVAVDGLTKLEAAGFEADDKAFIDQFGLTYLKGRKTPEERAKDAAEKMAAAQQAAPTAPEPGKPVVPEPKKDAPPPKKDARGEFAAALASGDVADGFLAGQLYTDAVGDSATAAGIEALEPTLAAIAAEIEAATDYEDLRDRLRALYRDKLNAEDLNEIMYRAMTLAHLAGRVAVQQDA